MSEEQIKMIASDISIPDVLDYIQEHQIEYEQYLVNENKEENTTDEENIQAILNTGTLEIPINLK